MNTKTPRFRALRACRSGFTMVEILAVIAVIAVLMSVAAVGIQKMDQGQATGSALSVSEALFDEARSAAVGRGTRSRIYIHNDPSPEQRDRYLRFMAVGIEVDGEWEFSSRGISLPSGVYFDEAATNEATGKVPGIGTYGTTTISLPGDRNNPVSCIFYEFNAEGICVREGATTPGAAFVVVGGVLPPNETRPIVRGNNRTGFVVWRNGRTSIFRNPEHITSSTN